MENNNGSRLHLLQKIVLQTKDGIKISKPNLTSICCRRPGGDQEQAGHEHGAGPGGGYRLPDVPDPPVHATRHPGGQVIASTLSGLHHRTASYFWEKIVIRNELLCQV